MTRKLREPVGLRSVRREGLSSNHEVRNKVEAQGSPAYIVVHACAKEEMVPARKFSARAGQ